MFTKLTKVNIKSLYLEHMFVIMDLGTFNKLGGTKLHERREAIQ